MGKKKHGVGRVRSWRSLGARVYGLHVWGSCGEGDGQHGVCHSSRASELAFGHQGGRRVGGGRCWRQRPVEGLIDGEGTAKIERERA